MDRNPRRRAGTLLFRTAMAFAAGGAPAAQAHGTVAAGDFYTGMLHPVIHLEQVLAFLALGLWCGQTGGDKGLRAAATAIAFVGLGVLAQLRGIGFSTAPAAAAASLIAIGLLVALRRPLPDALGLPLAALLGSSHGFALADGMAEQLSAPLGYAIGVVLSTSLVLFYAALLVRRFEAFLLQVAVRIAGSWIAATGLILSALRLSD